MRWIALLFAMLGCAGSTKGVTHARNAYYHDNSGLDVNTAYIETAQQVSGHVDVSGRGLVDYLAIHRKQLDPTDPGAHSQPSGHPADVVTSASSIAAAGAVSRKERYEGSARIDYHDDSPIPWRAWFAVRTSHEPDYASISGIVGGQVELGTRDTVLAADLGFGRDTVSPVEAPPGELDAWPASHHRITSSVSASQVMSQRLVLSAGLAATWQRGQLANPYRRAIVKTTLFPEVVPDERNRFVGYVGAAFALTRDTAIHARMSAYRDSWSVSSWAPELAIVHSFGERGLATAYYRYFRQSAADFYLVQYSAVERYMSGDTRLGEVEGHAGGAHVSWIVRGDRDAEGAVTVEAGYDVMRYHYLLLFEVPTIGQMFTLGLSYAN